MCLSSVHASAMTTAMKEYRLKRDLSQRDLANMVEMAGQRLFGEEFTCEAAWVARWEKGKHIPAPRHLLAILVATQGTVRRIHGRLSLEELVRP